MSNPANELVSDDYKWCLIPRSNDALTALLVEAADCWEIESVKVCMSPDKEASGLLVLLKHVEPERRGRIPCWQ